MDEGTIAGERLGTTDEDLTNTSVAAVIEAREQETEKLDKAGNEQKEQSAQYVCWIYTVKSEKEDK